MNRKKSPGKYDTRTLDKLDDIHKELRQMNEYLDDMIESKRTEKTEISFLLSLVGVAISVSSLLVKSLSGDSRVLLVGGGISVLLLFMVASYIRKIQRNRPIPLELTVMFIILLMISVYSVGLGLELF